VHSRDISQDDNEPNRMKRTLYYCFPALTPYTYLFFDFLFLFLIPLTFLYPLPFLRLCRVSEPLCRLGRAVCGIRVQTGPYPGLNPRPKEKGHAHLDGTYGNWQYGCIASGSRVECAGHNVIQQNWRVHHETLNPGFQRRRNFFIA
jgi:hypothetical protein